MAGAKPNAAHVAFARFAASRAHIPGAFRLVTQNIDGLHECAARACGAGAESIVAMHGSLARSRCSACGRVFPDDRVHLDESGAGELPLSACCGVLLRPDVVWFGEMPMEMETIVEAVLGCDCFVSIGTSGSVYPAAGLIEIARKAEAFTLCLNREPIPQQCSVDCYVEGAATETVPSLFV
jgi:NAD-dependent deacetylase